MTANGTLYTSGSGDSNGMVMNIASSDVSSANIYYGKSLMTKIDASLSNFLEFNGDINSVISYIMMNGLQKGENYTWSFKLQRKLSKLLDINFVCS